MSANDRFRRDSVFVLAVALAAGGFGLAAQEGTEVARFGEAVEVRLVNVEAWVTDARGEPVSELTAADFELLEDGEPVEITHFSEIGVERLDPVAAAPEPAAPAPQATRPPAPPPSPAYLVLYFDQIHLTATSRKRLIEDLPALLDSRGVAPERVLILRQEQDLYTEAGFGADRRELEQALERIAGSGTAGTLTAQDKRLAIGRLQQLWEDLRSIGAPGADPCDGFVLKARGEVEAHAVVAARRIAVTLDNLIAVASFLGGLDGVKVLVYVSDALETTPGDDLRRVVQELCPRAQPGSFRLPPPLGRQFEEMTRGANTNRVTFYALQPSGLGSGSLTSADRRGADFRFRSGLIEGALRQGERSGMSLIAAETGGRAVFNKNRFGEDLARIAAETTSYYSLAYEPPHGGDRRAHRIEVRLPGRPGLVVRHRQAYRDKGPEEELADRLLSSLYLGVGENPLAARLGAGAIRQAERGRYAVPLHVLVPADRLTYLPVEGEPLGGVTVEVAAKDPERPGIVRTRASFEIAPPAGGADPAIDLVLSLELPPGRYVLAVAVRDLTSRETSYVSTSIEIAPDEEEAS